MPLTGKAARDFMDEASRKEDQRRAEMLAKAKADPIEERRKEFEFKYCVNNPDISTIKDFAAFIERVNKW